MKNKDIQHNVQNEKQSEHNLMKQLTCLLFVLLLLDVSSQHEPVVMSDTFLMSMMQCESFLMIILCGWVFAIDVLFRVSLLKSILEALTFTYDEFGLNLAQINKIADTCDNNSDLTMIVKDVLQCGDVGIGM